MVERFDVRRNTLDTARAGAAVDEGLRSYMLKVYNYMASALLLTGMVALLTAQSETMMQAIFGTPLMWVVIFAPLVLVFALSAGVNRMRASTLQALFWVYAALVGLSIASIFAIYTGESVARVFFITAASFGALSLWGYTTKRDLTGFGSFLIMGLFGIIIASVVNIFLKSTGLQFAVSVLGVLIFAGLTAYDTQKIKEMYWHADGGEVATKKAVMGALSLYLDFLNMFLMLLRLFGERR